MAEQMHEQNAVSSASDNHFNHVGEQETQQEQQKQQPDIKSVFTPSNDIERTSTTLSQERGERFSLREEIIALAERWIADADQDEQERKTLQHVKEDVLAAIDNTTARGAR